MIYIDHVEDLMWQWAAAAREAVPKIGHKPTFLATARGSVVRSAAIDPDDFDAVDMAVSALKEVDKQAWDVITIWFLQGQTARHAARQLHVSTSTISQLKAAGVAFVAGAINAQNRA